MATRLPDNLFDDIAIQPQPAFRGTIDDYDDIFAEAADSSGVSKALIKAIAKTESGGRADSVSPTGNKGIMQLSDALISQYGITDWQDPRQNIMGGARYIKELLQQFGGNRVRAVAAYQAGPTRVARNGGPVSGLSDGITDNAVYTQRVLDTADQYTVPAQPLPDDLFGDLFAQQPKPTPAQPIQLPPQQGAAEISPTPSDSAAPFSLAGSESTRVTQPVSPVREGATPAQVMGAPEPVKETVKPGVFTPVKGLVSGAANIAANIVRSQEYVDPIVAADADMVSPMEAGFNRPRNDQLQDAAVAQSQALRLPDNKLLTPIQVQQKLEAQGEQAQNARQLEALASKIEGVVPEGWEKEVEAATEGPLVSWNIPQVANTWATLVAQNLPQLATQVATPVGSAGLLIAQERGGFLDAARQLGLPDEISSKHADTYAVPAGTSEYLDNVIAIGPLKKTPIGKAASAVKDKLITKIGKEVGALTIEGGQETFQQALQNYYLGKAAKEAGWTEEQVREKVGPLIDSRNFWIGFGVAAGTRGLARGARKVLDVAAKQQLPEQTNIPETAAGVDATGKTATTPPQVPDNVALPNKQTIVAPVDNLPKSAEEFYKLPDEEQQRVFGSLSDDLRYEITVYDPQTSKQDLEAKVAAIRDRMKKDYDVEDEDATVNHEPTDAQKEAGNYKKAHIKRDGFDISIENPAGGVRSGIDEDGKAWSQELKSDYGYIRGTVGKDKDHIDVFIKPESDAGGTVYVVNQLNPKTKKFDEHKVILGAKSEEEAKQLYLENYEQGWQGLGSIVPMSQDEFKGWVYSDATKAPAPVKKQTLSEVVPALKAGSKPVKANIIERQVGERQKASDSLRFVLDKLGVKDSNEYASMTEDEQAKRFGPVYELSKGTNQDAVRAADGIIELNRILDLHEQQTEPAPAESYIGREVMFRGPAKKYKGKTVEKLFDGKIESVSDDGQTITVKRMVSGQEQLWTVSRDKVTDVEGLDQVPEKFVGQTTKVSTEKQELVTQPSKGEENEGLKEAETAVSQTVATEPAPSTPSTEPTASSKPDVEKRKVPLTDKYIDSLWKRIESKMKIPFSDDDANLEGRLQKAIDKGSIKSKDDLLDFIANDPVSLSQTPLNTSRVPFKDYKNLTEQEQQQIYEQNPATGRPGQGEFDRVFASRTENGKKRVAVAIGDINGFKVYNDIFGMGPTDLLNARIFDIVQKHLGAGMVQNLHGDEYAAHAGSVQDLRARIKAAMTDVARLKVTLPDGRVLRPTMSWRIGEASTPEEAGKINPKDKVEKNSIGVDRQDGTLYTLKGADRVTDQEIARREEPKKEESADENSIRQRGHEAQPADGRPSVRNDSQTPVAQGDDQEQTQRVGGADGRGTEAAGGGQPGAGGDRPNSPASAPDIPRAKNPIKGPVLKEFSTPEEIAYSQAVFKVNLLRDFRAFMALHYGNYSLPTTKGGKQYRLALLKATRDKFGRLIPKDDRVEYWAKKIFDDTLNSEGRSRLLEERLPEPSDYSVIWDWIQEGNEIEKQLNKLKKASENSKKQKNYSQKEDAELRAAIQQFEKDHTKLTPEQRTLLEETWQTDLDEVIRLRDEEIERQARESVDRRAEEQDVDDGIPRGPDGEPMFAKSSDQMGLELDIPGASYQQNLFDAAPAPEEKPKKQKQEFSDQTRDMFEGSEFADMRSETKKAIDKIRREREEARKTKDKGLEGLPLFDKNEQEAMATKQYDLFSAPQEGVPTLAVEAEQQSLFGNDAEAKESLLNPIPPQPKVFEKEPDEKISDFGEKIGGARKDMWTGRTLNRSDLQSMTERELYKFATKEEVWPRPDYEALVEAGAPRNVVFMMKLIRDSIAVRPAKMSPSKEDYGRYVDLVSSIRDGATAAKSMDELRGVFKITFGPHIEDRQLTHEGNNLARLIGGNALRKMQFNPYDLVRAERFLRNSDWPKKAGENAVPRGYKIRQSDKGYYIVKGHYYVNDGYFPTEAEALAWIKDYIKSNAAKKVVDIPQLDNIQRIGKDYRNGKDVTTDDLLSRFGFRGGEFGNWVNQKERQQYINYAYDALMDLSEVIGVPPKALSLNGELGIAFGARGTGGAKAHYEPVKIVINLTRLHGAGSLAHEWAHALDDYFARQSKNATPSLFGMSNVKTPGENRPEVHAAIKEVFSVMSKREMTPEEAVAARAKSEERTTKNARSWIKGMLVDLKQRKPDVDQKQLEEIETLAEKGAIEGDELALGESFQKYKAIAGVLPTKTNRDALNSFMFSAKYRNANKEKTTVSSVDTSYKKNSRELDNFEGRKKVYWSTAEEMFARAFASYVDDEIRKAGRSDYLVHSTAGWPENGVIPSPYPFGAERKQINSAFDKLFSILKTKETEKGTAIFAKGEYATERQESRPDVRFADPGEREAKTAAMLRTSFAQKFDVKVDENDIEIFGAPENPETQIISKLIRTISRKRVVFMRVSPQLEKRLGFFIDGFSYPKAIAPELSNTVFLDVNSIRPYLWTASHEMAHFLFNERPDLYKQLWSAIQLTDAGRAELRKRAIAENNISAGVDEFSADIVGEMMTREDFWRELENLDQNAFRQIIRELINILGRVVKKMRELLVGEKDAGARGDLEQNIADVARVRRELAKVLAAYSKNEKIAAKQAVPAGRIARLVQSIGAPAFAKSPTPKSPKEIAETVIENKAATAESKPPMLPAVTRNEKHSAKSPLAGPMALAEAVKRSAVRMEEIQEMREEIKRMRDARKLLKKDQVKERIRIGLDIKKFENRSIDKVKDAVLDYGRRIGLTGIPYNKVALLVKTARTQKALRDALEIMDRAYEDASRMESINKLLDLIDQKYRQLRKAQSTTVSPTDIENNRKLKDYLDTLMEARPEQQDAVNKLLAYLNTEGPELVKGKMFEELPESIQAWAEDPLQPMPSLVKDAVKAMAMKKVTAMSLSEILQAIEDINQLAKDGRTAQARKQIAQIERERAVAGEIASEIVSADEMPAAGVAAAVDEGYLAARKKSGIGNRILERFMWQVRDIDRIGIALTGKTSGTAFERFIIRPMADATIKVKRILENVEKFYKDAYGDIDMADVRTKPWIEIDMKVGKSADNKAIYGTVPITIEQGMFIYAHAKNVSQREHLIATISDEREKANEIIDRVVNELPQKYKDAVEKQWQYYDIEQYPLMSEVFSLIHSVDMNHEKYYFPATNLKTNSERAIDADLMARAAMQASVNMGSTKERIVSGKDVFYRNEATGDIATQGEFEKMDKSQQGLFTKVVPPVRSAPFRHMRYFDVVVPNMREAAHYVGMTVPVRNVQRVLSQKELRERLEGRSPAVRGVILDWLKGLAYGKWTYGDSKNPINPVIKYLRQAAGRYQILGRVSSLLVQASSVARGMAMVDPRRVGGSLAQFLRNPNEFWDSVNTLSQQMKTRTKDYEQAFQEFMETSDGKRMVQALGPIDKATEFLGNVIGAVDKFWSGLVWHAKFSESLAKGMSDSDAVYEADKVVRKTQSGGGLLAANAFQRGSEVERAFTQFLSDAVKAANLLDELVQGWSGMSAKDRAQYIVFGLLATAAITHLIRSGFDPLREPEEWFRELVKMNTDSIPFVGQAVDLVTRIGADKIKQARGAKASGNYSMLTEMEAPAVSIVGDIFDDFIKLQRGKRWEEKPIEQVFTAIDMLALIKGLPGGGQLKRLVSGVPLAVQHGDPRYLIWGKSSLENGAVVDDMIERRNRPRSGSEDSKIFKEWYNDLSDSEKEKFLEKYQEKIEKKAKEEAKKEEKKAKKQARAAVPEQPRLIDQAIAIEQPVEKSEHKLEKMIQSVAVAPAITDISSIQPILPIGANIPVEQAAGGPEQKPKKRGRRVFDSVAEALAAGHKKDDKIKLRGVGIVRLT